ncbi:MAG TPA: response regulator [Terracidiphilus sp.]|nr:response regulator [Terracidiphilus sp.]
MQNSVVILCVDDEENPLILRKLVLQKHGFQVVTATSARMAMETLNHSHIDLVVSDQLMPGVTGTELAQQIKLAHPHLPVVLLSGVNEIPPDVHYADLFVSKVEGPRALCEHITEVLTQRGILTQQRTQ